MSKSPGVDQYATKNEADTLYFGQVKCTWVKKLFGIDLLSLMILQRV